MAEVIKDGKRVIVLSQKGNQSTAMLADLEARVNGQNPILGELCRYVSIYSKSDKKTNEINAALARIKRAIRQITAEQAELDAEKTKRFVQFMISTAESNWLKFEEEGYKVVAKEEEAFAAMLTKLLAK